MLGNSDSRSLQEFSMSAQVSLICICKYPVTWLNGASRSTVKLHTHTHTHKPRTHKYIYMFIYINNFALPVNNCNFFFIFLFLTVSLWYPFCPAHAAGLCDRLWIVPLCLSSEVWKPKRNLELLFRDLCGSLGLQVVVRCVHFKFCIVQPSLSLPPPLHRRSLNTHH
jgi:hypothetical protein